MTKRAAVIINPTKNAAGDVRGIITRLSAAEGWEEPLWLETTADDPGHGQAREALDAGADVVIAAGGDGTVRVVAEELAGTDIPLGLIPLGTGNLLARNLEMPLNDLEGAARVALTGGERRIDVVYVNVDKNQKAHIFLVMAGLGFDAAVMADTNENLKDRVGWLAYIDAGIRNLPGKPARTRITFDDAKPLGRRLRSVMGGNCGRIQGGLEIFPGAKLDDGVLDIMTIAPSGTFGWVGVLAGIFSRGRSKNPAVEYFQTRSAVIETAEPQEIQLDGDHLGEGKHLAMRLDPGALVVRTA